MARKGRNIYKRKDGRWEGRVVLGYSREIYIFVCNQNNETPTGIYRKLSIFGNK